MKNIAYWEAKWHRAHQRLDKMRRAHPECPPPHPKTYLLKNSQGERIRSESFNSSIEIWVVSLREWRAREKAIRTLEQRVVFYHQQIAALEKRTLWDRLRKR